MNVRITFSYMVFFFFLFSKEFWECCYDSDDGVCVYE